MSSEKDYRVIKGIFPALPSILEAERVLRQVLGEHVYVGGACVGFYVDDPGAVELRPTDDVDVIVEIVNEVERVHIDKSLRKAGLFHDMNGPICRWKLQNLTVDIMPTGSHILGFSNDWYPQALSGANTLSIDGLEVKIPNVCTFIATKIAAFGSRGENDFVASSDFEDIVRILDGCSFLAAEASTAPRKVQVYVSETFKAWRDRRAFQDGIAAHLVDGGSGSRTDAMYQLIDVLIRLPDA